MIRQDELVLLLPLPSHAPDSHHILLTKKAIEGLEHYAKHWNGPVRVILPPGGGTTGNLDDVITSKDSLSFAAEVRPFRPAQLLEHLAGAAIVMGGPSHSLNGMSTLCRRAGIPYVLNSEYTLKTRLQIVSAERTSPLLKLRRYAWEWLQERAFRGEVTNAVGVQCNGVPTFEAYRGLSPAPLLYFDTRITPSLLSRPEHVREKYHGAPRRTLRLAFSGRLNAMKGADHLPRLAHALRQRGVPFQLDICGGGPLEAEMREQVSRLGLEASIRFRGIMDFQAELIPFIRDEIDLFVCCHRQGDPSCTYLETWACGVPLAGYDNEAFTGLLKRVPGGWTAPMNAVDRLAEIIADLWRTPEELEAAGLAGLRFAADHIFDTTFSKRLEHLKYLSRSA